MLRLDLAAVHAHDEQVVDEHRAMVAALRRVELRGPRARRRARRARTALALLPGLLLSRTWATA